MMLCHQEGLGTQRSLGFTCAAAGECNQCRTAGVERSNLIEHCTGLCAYSAGAWKPTRAKGQRNLSQGRRSDAQPLRSCAAKKALQWITPATTHHMTLTGRGIYKDRNRSNTEQSDQKNVKLQCQWVKDEDTVSRDQIARLELGGYASAQAVEFTEADHAITAVSCVNQRGRVS